MSQCTKDRGPNGDPDGPNSCLHRAHFVVIMMSSTKEILRNTE